MDSKILDRILKLKKQAESELSIGNSGAAELFQDKVEEQLSKYNLTLENILSFEKELQASDIKIVNNLGKSIIANPFLRINAKTDLRKLWFEKLAEVVAEGYFCKVQAKPNSEEVIFYGLDSDRDIAIFMFLKLAEIGNDLCKKEMYKAKSEVGLPPKLNPFAKNPLERKISYPSEWMGNEVFIDSFHKGFREALAGIYKDHVQSEFTKKKTEDVEKFFLEERVKDVPRNRYYQVENEFDIIEQATSQEVIEIGKRAGTFVAKRATKNPSALVVKNGKASSLFSDKHSVYLLIDNSGSMCGFKIQQAKLGAKDFALEAFRKGWKVGLISFETKVHHLIKLQDEMNPKFEAAIDKLQDKGGTNMADAISAARMYLTDRRNKRTIVIVTDGQPSEPNRTLQVATEAKRDGIDIIAIGTDDANQEFLNKLASREGLGLLVNNQRLALTMGEMANKL